MHHFKPLSIVFLFLALNNAFISSSAASVKLPSTYEITRPVKSIYSDPLKLVKESIKGRSVWRPLPTKILNLLERGDNDKTLFYDPRAKFIPKVTINNRFNRPIKISPYKLKLRTGLLESELYSWYNFLGGGLSADSPIPEPGQAFYSETGELDLLKYARDISLKLGMVKAKEMLINELKKRDGSIGELERRIAITSIDKKYIFENSLVTIPSNERKKIGVFFCLGIGGDKSVNAVLIRRASARVLRLGFTSEMLEVSPKKGSIHNAKMLSKMLLKRVPNLDHIVIVAASKGVSDFITYFLNYGETLSERNREKFKLMISLAGVIRGAHIAKYLSNAKDLKPLMLRAWYKTTFNATIDGLKSAQHSPWKGHYPSKVIRLYPNLTWISFPVIPEGPDGYTSRSQWSGPLRLPAHRYLKEASPGDGLVETAASILPPDTNIPEWIIPVYGAHALATGHYANGTLVAPISQKDRGNIINPAAGDEMLDSYMRAIPSKILFPH